MSFSTNDTELASCLSIESGQHILDRTCNAEASAMIVGTAGEVEAHRFGICCIHHQGAGITAVRKTVSADSDLVRKGLPIVRLGFCAVFVVVNFNAEIDGIDR